MFILLFFCCCAQGETTFDQDGENPSSQDGKNLEAILRKLIVMLNNDVLKRMSNLERDMEVMKEKESAGSSLKWERKAPVIKAETPKGFMAEIVDLERLFSELRYGTYRRRWGVF